MAFSWASILAVIPSPAMARARRAWLSGSIQDAEDTPGDIARLARWEAHFIARLPYETGRPLAYWLDAISGLRQGDAITYLQLHAGLIFREASWVERIAAYGGEPIYCSADTFASTSAGRASGKAPAELLAEEMAEVESSASSAKALPLVALPDGETPEYQCLSYDKALPLAENVAEECSASTFAKSSANTSATALPKLCQSSAGSSARPLPVTSAMAAFADYLIATHGGGAVSATLNELHVIYARESGARRWPEVTTMRLAKGLKNCGCKPETRRQPDGSRPTLYRLPTRTKGGTVR